MAWYYEEFPTYVSAAERRAQAEREAQSLRKQGKKLRPVKIDGTKIAKTFWGKAWCQHLEGYSDYANRLPRGRSYARNGSVIDLGIEKGAVRARVSGSYVYEVEIDVQALPKPRWTALVSQCAGQIDSVVELLSGRLPDAVMEVLCDRVKGLFPATKELSLSCSCPDVAGLCKHLAAVLYGIGARLDHEPELLFVLRGVDQTELLGGAGGALVGKGTSQLADDELENIFGIELETAPKSKLKPRAKPKKKKRTGAAAGRR